MSMAVYDLYTTESASKDSSLVNMWHVHPWRHCQFSYFIGYWSGGVLSYISAALSLSRTSWELLLFPMVWASWRGRGEGRGEKESVILLILYIHYVFILEWRQQTKELWMNNKFEINFKTTIRVLIWPSKFWVNIHIMIFWLVDGKYAF